MNTASALTPLLKLSYQTMRHCGPWLATLWSPVDHQEAVNVFFRTRSTYWKDVYAAETLSGIQYRTRKDKVLRFVDQLALPAGSRLMDAGCGAGFMTVALAERGFDVYAVDTVPQMIEKTLALAQCARVAERVDAQIGDVQRLDFSDCEFDAVLAIGVLPWLSDPFRALLELVRVLKPGGHAILAVDNGWSLSNILDPLCFPGLRRWRRALRDQLQRAGFLEPSPRPSLRFHSGSEFDSLLSGAGLVKTQAITYGFGPFTLFKMSLFSESVGIKLHRGLQYFADRNAPGIRSTGIGHIVVAKKISGVLADKRCNEIPNR